jgi:hypothetical protein
LRRTNRCSTVARSGFRIDGLVTRIEAERIARGPIRTPAEVIPIRAVPSTATAEPASAPVEAEVVPMRPVRPRAGLNDRLERVTVPPPRVRTPKAAAVKPAEPDDSFEPDEPSPERDDAVARSGQTFYLTADQDVVDGPSIGPKTAQRLQAHGVNTVRDLLKSDPAALSVLLNARHLTPETISAWQDQALLVCSVPGLRGTHAQLLVGAGYRSADAIAEAEPDKLCADVLTFATSTSGQRVLRSGDPPDIERIKTWLEAARSVRAA